MWGIRGRQRVKPADVIRKGTEGMELDGHPSADLRPSSETNQAF